MELLLIPVLSLKVYPFYNKKTLINWDHYLKHEIVDMQK